MAVVFHLYRGDDQEPITVKAGADLEQFAEWAAKEGGEAARLVLEGHSDVYNPNAADEFGKQLYEAPQGETVDALREAMTTDVSGILVSEEEETPSRYAAVQPSPDGKIHRDSFGFREAGGQPQSCASCRYYQPQDTALGQCIFFASMMQAEPEKYQLSASTGPEFWCESWESNQG